MKVKLGFVALVTVGAISGCGLTAHTGEHFEMAGTPEGIRAFSDTLVGSMKTAKESPNAPSQYFRHRNSYEREVTARELHRPKSFLQKLFEQDESRDTTDSNTVTEEAGS